jgi:hypothetical protein
MYFRTRRSASLRLACLGARAELTDPTKAQMIGARLASGGRKRPVAFRSLVKAAGGAANLTAYCSTVPHPGASQSAAAIAGEG